MAAIFPHKRIEDTTLLEYPGAKQLAGANLTHLKAVLYEASKGRYGCDRAIELRSAARNSIGSCMPAKSLELKHTIRLDHMNIVLDKWLKCLYNEFGFSEYKFSKGEAVCFLVVKKSRS